ncbi:hypothetical protein [Luteolibacter flavescens]|nr:hypothetical protein [Luteolibacter flavescens]
MMKTSEIQCFTKAWLRSFRPTIAMLACLLSSSCDPGKKWSSGDYAVYSIGSIEDQQLGREVDSGNYIGRVEATVIAAGADDTWIVAARKGPDGSRLFYYFMKSRDDGFMNGEDLVEGPFDEAEFAKRKREYALPELQYFYGGS